MWTVSEPVVREWMERHLGPAGRIEDAAQGAAGFLAGMPGLMTRGAVLVEQLDAITRDGLILAPETVAAIGTGRGAAQPLDGGGAVADRRAAGLDGWLLLH